MSGKLEEVKKEERPSQDDHSESSPQSSSDPHTSELENLSMMKKYEKKGDRQTWSKETMVKAVKDVLEGKMTCFKASKTYSLPLSTLKYKIKKARRETNVHELVRKPPVGMKRVFTEEQELQLACYVSFMESSLQGITITEVRKIAFEIAERYNIRNSFNKQERMAGMDWLNGFLKRHQLDVLFFNKKPEKKQEYEYDDS